MPAGNRKSTLLTHVEPDVEIAIKRLADVAGMSTSSYIRQLLRMHVDEPGVKSLLRKQW